VQAAHDNYAIVRVPLPQVLPDHLNHFINATVMLLGGQDDREAPVATLSPNRRKNLSQARLDSPAQLIAELFGSVTAQDG